MEPATPGVPAGGSSREGLAWFGPRVVWCRQRQTAGSPCAAGSRCAQCPGESRSPATHPILCCKRITLGQGQGASRSERVWGLDRCVFAWIGSRQPGRQLHTTGAAEAADQDAVHTNPDNCAVRAPGAPNLQRNLGPLPQHPEGFRSVEESGAGSDRGHPCRERRRAGPAEPMVEEPNKGAYLSHNTWMRNPRCSAATIPRFVGRKGERT